MSVTGLKTRRAGRPRLTLLAALPLVAMLFLMLGAGSAAATPTADGAERAEGKVVEAEMRLDCTNMSESVHDYAVEHGYCPSEDDVGPDDIRYGSCGSSEIWISSAGGGDASIEYGFNSSLGPVVYRNLGIGYAGDDDSGGWNDSGVMASSSYYAADTLFTGVGQADTSLGGTVTLAWGGQCTLLEPHSTAFIS